MKIAQYIDGSNLRKESLACAVPIVDLLMKKIKTLSESKKTQHTLFAVCPNSLNVLKAALRSAQRANSPIMFAATLNQVDTDRGYTGWTQMDLIKIINEQSGRIGFEGPAIVAIDHGGPWVKDIQTVEKWPLKKAMNWTKKSFEAAIMAGYDMIHVDPTVDIFNEILSIETVANRTIELIKHCESFRVLKKKPPISYEVGTEEVKGGLADLNIFKKFLKLLRAGLQEQGIGHVWPVFVVGKVGTDLHTTEFDPVVAKTLVKTASSENTYIKGHYTDFVVNPHQYPESGIGAANVGPEFTSVEYDAFNELSSIEEELYAKNRIAIKSEFRKTLEKAIIDSGRWKKWLKPGEKDLFSINTVRKDLILKTSARYVWSNPAVVAAQIQLYKNLENNGYDPENWILLRIESSIDKYFRAFNLIDINYRL